MSKLTTGQRKAIPTSEFAGPNRSYPIPDRSHAANAKARASEMYNRGVLSAAVKARIDAKANAKLKG
jgi:hypothetical protein